MDEKSETVKKSDAGKENYTGEKDDPITITAYPNGPLIVRGPAVFVNESGDAVNQPRRTVALCRCGSSTIKPWCDGSHKLTGFTTDEE